ncbi:choice-of-anchor I family protein [Saccharospirillum impatiens]|uniref:choice-of-anchor I family protein n=1 Tax=Saccharospirillum impatiens TaxID=169438 RepID=UPI000425FDD7|nr:choice-of-anchor I family protein [Saccharospirillum impatiens]
MTPLKPLAITFAAGLTLSACSTNPTQSADRALPAGDPSVQIDMVGRYTSGIFDESAAEIVAYHQASGFAYLTNGATGRINAVRISNLLTESTDAPYTLSNLADRSDAVPAQVWVADPYTGYRKIMIGGANSLAVHGDLLAIAVENESKVDKGAILFYRLNDQGDTDFVKGVLAGALPDMVTFSPDGRYVLVANEGEPSGDYLIDPEGSVSVIPVTRGIPDDLAIQLNFNGFDDNHHPDIITANNPDPEYTRLSQNLEPEYITVTPDSRTAFVSLQENNALAKISLSDTPSITGLYPLGFKDHSLADNSLDANKDDEVAALATYAGLYGTYHPDSIASYSINGRTYVVTANEGDAREYFSDAETEAQCQGALPMGQYDWDEDDGCLVYTDETEIGDVQLAASLAGFDDIGGLKINKALGDANGDGVYESVYAYGARSFAIFDDIGALVYDSGDLIERITADRFPAYFNTTDNELAVDDRSDNKGPEPEALTLGQLGDRTLAFVGLERMGGFMTFDITNPEAVQFVAYTNHRNYDATAASANGDITAQAGDLAPEGMQFIPASQSPSGVALLLVANEVSGSLSVYQVQQQ